MLALDLDVETVDQSLTTNTHESTRMFLFAPIRVDSRFKIKKNNWRLQILKFNFHWLIT